MPRLVLEEERSSFSETTTSGEGSHTIAPVIALERLRTKQFVVDALLAVAIFVLGLTSQVDAVDAGIGPFSREPDALNVVLIALTSLSLVGRRIFPTAVLVVVLGSWALDRLLDYPTTLASAGILLAFHSVGTELSPERSLRVGGSAVGLVTAWTVVGAITLDSVPWASVLTQLLVTAGPLWLGREVHERRRRIEALEERARRAESEREEQARRAVAEERSRIARELHDVVAHQMTVMTIQADGARRIADGADPRVREALETIKATGHAALAEMRRVVGLLREADESPELAPLPHLSDLETLANHVRSAGVQVELEVKGAAGPLADGVELSAYRIVQESLTNAVRHGGPGVTATVTVTFGDDSLDVLVVDDGRGAAAAPSNGGGHGLVGMRERVAVLGGSFQAGPKPGGGYRVHAIIPYQS